MHQWGNGKPIQIKLELRTEHDNIVGNFLYIRDNLSPNNLLLLPVAQKVFDLGETEETFDWSIEPNLINSTDKKNHFTLSMQLRLLYAGRLVATVDAVIQEDTR